ncbi:MAG: GTPase Era [Candidatus Shapirobacteria bacterium]|nr:GTPase Era [Candidatus Shapirobacteria bacterium]
MINMIKFGRVVILGRPNTGKSTLLNAIMQQKVAITSHLPQTTRKVSRVVFENEIGKIIFSDTPGIIGKIDDLMGQRVNQEAPRETGVADVLIMVVDISRPKNEEENKVIGLIRKSTAKKILVFNKIDAAVGSKDHLADYEYLEDEFDKSIKVSAIKEIGIKGLIKLIMELLPEEDEVKAKQQVEIINPEGKPKISMDSKEFVSEIIREKAYLFLRDEIPYSVNVEVEKIQDKRKLILIKANIITDSDRYKKIIIGAGGNKIKEIGFNARKELELMSSRKIFLELTVVTDRHWMEKLS